MIIGKQSIKIFLFIIGTNFTFLLLNTPITKYIWQRKILENYFFVNTIILSTMKSKFWLKEIFTFHGIFVLSNNIKYSFSPSSFSFRYSFFFLFFFFRVLCSLWIFFPLSLIFPTIQYFSPNHRNERWIARDSSRFISFSIVQLWITFGWYIEMDTRVYFFLFVNTWLKLNK